MTGGDWLTKKDLQLDIKTTALLVVDMQNDFVHERGGHAKIYDVKPLRRIINQLRKLLESARNVGVPIIYTKMVHRGPAYQRKLSVGRSIVIREGTWNAEIIDELKPKPSDYIVEKRRYSAFYNTDLEVLLKGLDTETVIVTGVGTNVCVESTVRDAIDRDYRVILVKDCTASPDPKSHAATCRNVKIMAGEVLSSEELMKAFKKCNVRFSPHRAHARESHLGPKNY